MEIPSSVVSSILGQKWWNHVARISTVLYQKFGNVLLDSDLDTPRMYHGSRIRPRTGALIQSSGKSEVRNEKDSFQVRLDVSQFNREEIVVTVGDDHVIVRGEHGEKSDEHGFVSREFTRRYELPEGTVAESIRSSYNEDGILTIEATKRVIEVPPSIERVIPITQSLKPEEVSGN